MNKELNESISAEWLTDRGYEIDPTFGANKHFGDLLIMVGYFPRNAPCVSIRFENVAATIITNATTTDDIETLERLLGNPFIDDDLVEYVDEEMLSDMDANAAEE